MSLLMQTRELLQAGVDTTSISETRETALCQTISEFLRNPFSRFFLNAVGRFDYFIFAGIFPDLYIPVQRFPGFISTSVV